MKGRQRGCQNLKRAKEFFVFISRKGCIVTAFALICSSQMVAQALEFHSDRIGISAGLGVNYHDAKDIVDRINGNSVTTQRVADFKSGVEFFGAVSIPLSPDWVVKLEY